MLKHHHKKKGFFIFLIVIVLFFLTLLYFGIYSDLSPVKIRDFVTQFGIFSPVIFIVINFLQVLFPIIPGQVMYITAGYLFGSVMGIIYSYFSVFFASLFVFYFSRKYGRKFIKKYVHIRDFTHLDHFIKKKGLMALILSRMIPFFPTDAINFVSGVSKLSYKEFFIGTLIGLVPNIVIFGIFGHRLAIGKLDLWLVVLILLSLLFGIFYMFRHQMKMFFIKEIRFIESKIKKRIK